jgi:MFS family permease
MTETRPSAAEPVAAPAGGAPAWVFLPLLLPFGISSGYASVTLSYLLSHAGMAPAAVAAVIAFSIWPQTWKVFWAPVVDTTLGPRRWHVMGCVAVGLSILGLSLIRAGEKTVPILIALIVVSSLASTLVSMSAEVFMADGVEDKRKGAVSGWSQAGNLGGAGLGGGLGLWLSQHAPEPWMGGATLCVLCIACSAALLLVPNLPHAHKRPHVFESLRDVVGDVWSVARSRPGLLVLVLMMLPIGSGGAQGLWSAIGGEWRANADTLALVNGVLGGVASLIGAVLAGFLCDLLDRRTAYCAFGLVLGVVTVVMAVAPRTREVFIVCTLAYALVLGCCYAAYSAAVLEAIGKGAAATKFNLLASVANIPIAVMTTTDGTLHDRFGSTGMLLGEGVIVLGAVVFFALFAELTRNRKKPRDYSLRLKAAD